MRWRTILSSITVLVWMIFYCLLAWYIGSLLPDSIGLMLIYAFVAGLLWVYPALKIIQWSKQDADSELRNP
jgi:hypothetical protein